MNATTKSFFTTGAAAVVAAVLAVGGVAALDGSSAAASNSGAAGAGSGSSSTTNPSPSGASHTDQVKPQAWVRTLQTELATLNYYSGPVNGYYGPITHSAVRNLQRDAGLPQTGELNAATRTAMHLMLVAGNSQMSGNTEGLAAAVETLESQLGQLNYYEGPVTGSINSQLTAAIGFAQRDGHLPVNGVWDQATQQVINQLLAHGNNVMGR